MWMTVLFLGLLTYWLYHEFFGKRQGFPPGPMPLPLIGNIHSIFVPGDSPQNRIQQLVNKYGSLMTIWVGTTPTVLITDYKMIKELFAGKSADAFSGRPPNYSLEVFTNGYHGIIASSGPLWKEQRRFSLQTLRNFGFGRNIMESKISLEIEILVERLLKMTKEAGGGEIRMDDVLQTCVGSIITNVILGHRFDQDDPGLKLLQEKLEENFQLITHPLVQMLSQAPPLRHLPFFSAKFAAMKSNRDSFYAYVNGEVQQHKKEYDPTQEPEDYAAAYLKEMHDRKEKGEAMGYFSEEQLIIALIDLWAAGMETTVTTLKWAFLYIINRPEIQEKIHKEVDNYYTSSEQPIAMADKPHLPFVSAVLSETQRIANIVPINLFHSVTQDVTVGGYHLPAGTTIVPQVSNVHLDPSIFPDPTTFNPERFLETDGKASKKVEELLPFSIGKRVCVGESLARMELFMIFVAVLRHFRLSSPDGQKLSETPVLGITLTPEPYSVLSKAKTT